MGSTAEMAITSAMMCKAPGYDPVVSRMYAISNGPTALAKPQAVNIKP